jgi:hypothetical protein
MSNVGNVILYNERQRSLTRGRLNPLILQNDITVDQNVVMINPNRFEQLKCRPGCLFTVMGRKRRKMDFDVQADATCEPHMIKMHETNRNNTVRINDRFQILPVFELIVPC